MGKKLRTSEKAVWAGVALLVTLFAGYALFLTVETPFDHVGSEMPKVSAIAAFERRGDGVIALTKVSSIAQYYRSTVGGQLRELRADARLRRLVGEELVGRGFEKVIQAKGVTYKRSTGGLFPIRSGVKVFNDGRVYVYAWRSKLPQLWAK
jgi:hypothetical protein